jgi:hypothetical protein
MARIGAFLSAVLVTCALGAAYGSSANPWVLTEDLLATSDLWLWTRR